MGIFKNSQHRIRNHSVLDDTMSADFFSFPPSPAPDNHLTDTRREGENMARGEELIWDIQMQFHRAGQFRRIRFLDGNFFYSHIVSAAIQPLLTPWLPTFPSFPSPSAPGNHLTDIRHGRGCIRVRDNLGRERLQCGHGTAGLQAADAYVPQTLVSAYDGGHKRSFLAEGYEVWL